MADDPKKMERLMKRAKPFLDDKLKANKRFVALKSVLELATSDTEMAKFFEAHDYSIYIVCVEYFQYRSAKIRQKQQGALNLLNNQSKDVTDTLEIIEVLHKLIK